MNTLIIKGELPSLNEIISAAKKGKGNYQPYSKMKHEYTDMIAWECKSQLKGRTYNEIKLDIVWYSPNAKKDIDNVSVGLKFILDGMVKAGVIENDGRKQVKGFNHKFEIDKQNPRVEIMINEVIGG